MNCEEVMRFLKRFFVFFIFPAFLIGIGFFCGIVTYGFFYPGETQHEDRTLLVNSGSGTLSVDTLYMILETDLDDETVVETSTRLPDKYIGMNRQQFVEAMELYEAFPPLKEIERGFVNLEVVSFSGEKVVVRMNYRYIHPGNSYYIAAFDNKLIVYLEDMKTVYIETEIRLDTLPARIRQEVIGMLWMEDDEKLYEFLETYSS